MVYAVICCSEVYHNSTGDVPSPSPSHETVFNLLSEVQDFTSAWFARPEASLFRDQLRVNDEYEVVQD